MIKRALSGLSLAAAVLLAPMAAAAPVQTSSGLVEGVEDNGVRVLLKYGVLIALGVGLFAVAGLVWLIARVARRWRSARA